MKKGLMFFRNSKKSINEGNGDGKGILYCGEEFTKNGYCPCGTCDGHCGMDNGCACPDCYYTLSYMLYMTGKMICPKCNKTLIRIIVANLKLLKKPVTKSNCDQCHKNYFQKDFIPLMHCIKCNYNLCPPCAFSKLSFYEDENINLPTFKISDLEAGFDLGVGSFYCKKNYVDSDFCICGGCDGNCGPENGCQCPLCDSILGYNIYLKNNLRCTCGCIPIKIPVVLLKNMNIPLLSIFGSVSLKCIRCSKVKDFNFQNAYFCKKCNKNICQACAFKENIYNLNNMTLPMLPFSMKIAEKQVKDKIRKETIEKLAVCRQKIIKFVKKKEGGKIICVYIKTLLGRIYSVNIDENEFVFKLIEELNKLDDDFKEYNTVLIYKNKFMDYNDFISDYKIENESIINAIIK